jgi:surface antigen
LRTSRSVRLAAAIALFLMGGCAEIEEHPQATFAPVAGGTAGLIAADAIGTTAAEAGLGALGVIAGVAAGPYLEKRDTVFFDRAIDVAAVAEPGKPVHWVNPNTGTKGILVREEDVDISVDLSCRRLRSEETLQTEIKIETMVVCRPDLGTWYIRSSWLVGTKPLDAPTQALDAPPADTTPAASAR